MQTKRRRSFEAGHRPKFLVIIDESAECGRAVHFAARRAARLGAAVVMLAIIQPGEFQHWLGVGDVMKDEAEEAASALQETFAIHARSAAGIEPEKVIRTGPKADEILKLIMEDEDIAYLVLATATGNEGPGPLVAGLAGKAAAMFPIPVVIVPGAMEDAEIDALA